MTIGGHITQLMVGSSLLFLTTLLFSRPAHADAGASNCKWSGVVTLTAPADYFCAKDLVIAGATRIITQGFPLQATVVGGVYYGVQPDAEKNPRQKAAVERPVHIISFAGKATPGRPGGPISIIAGKAYGDLEIVNLGSSPTDASGSVILEYNSAAPGYSQEITVAPNTAVEVLINGYPAKLSQPKYGLIRSH
jgi:hypothetical protein